MSDISDTSDTRTEQQGTANEPQQPDAPAPQGNPEADALGDAGKAAIDRMKAERTEAVRRAKALERELEQFRQASMSESEKAIAEAEARGRTAATVEFARERARSRFDALAAKRNPDADTDAITEFLDMGRFVGEDGTVDEKAVKAAVDKLVPVPVKKAVDYDGGGRQSAGTPSMDTLIRQAAGHR